MTVDAPQIYEAFRDLPAIHERTSQRTHHFNLALRVEGENPLHCLRWRPFQWESIIPGERERERD